MKKKLFLTIVLLLFITACAIDQKINEVRHLFVLKKFELALIKIDKILNDYPKQQELLFIKGLILFENGKNSESIEIFKLLTKLSPTKAQNYNYLGVGYMVQGDYIKAENAFLTAIEVKPDYIKVHENLGDLYISRARHADYIKIHENLGDLYISKARHAYMKALKLKSRKKSLISKLDIINNFPIVNKKKNELNFVKRGNNLHIINTNNIQNEYAKKYDKDKDDKITKIIKEVIQEWKQRK